MDIEIRRNRDICCDVTCENPEALKELFQMTDDQKRLQEEYEARKEAYLRKKRHLPKVTRTLQRPDDEAL